MQIAIPDAQKQIVAEIKKFVDREVIPVASELEHKDQYPEDIIEMMKGLGLFATVIPEKYGGLNLSFTTYAAIIEELARGWMSLAGVVNTHVIVSYVISQYGTEEQKERFLPRLAKGEIRAALCLTEPNAGSDVQALVTTATRRGDHYYINGTKMFITNGRRAGVFCVLTKTNKEANPPHRGMSVLLVEAGTPGFSAGRDIEKLGYKGVETTELIFEDAEVPVTNLLGGVEGQGFRHIMDGMETGRINVAARAVGVARAAFEDAIRYAQQRFTFGVPISEHQAIQFKLADMATKIEAARLLTMNAAAKKDAGERTDVEAGMAKLFASETAVEVTLDAMRIHGGYGYTKDMKVERYYRDAPVLAIAEGTNEIQRMVIARGLLRQYEAL